GRRLSLKVGDLVAKVGLFALVLGKIRVQNSGRRVGQVGEVGGQVVGESGRVGIRKEILQRAGVSGEHIGKRLLEHVALRVVSYCLVYGQGPVIVQVDAQ